MRKSLIGAVVVALIAGASWWGAVQLGSRAPTTGTAVTCPHASPVSVGQIVVPAGPVAGFCQPQLVMAAHIMNAARAQGIGVHTQAVGVMTAIGETGLRNLDYGDAAGPDSRGLFQQRDNGAWGTLAERMDPYTAATHFFRKLVTIDGWKTMSPTLLAHAVQVNSDANYYAQYWTEAQAIVAALNR